MFTIKCLSSLAASRTKPAKVSVDFVTAFGGVCDLGCAQHLRCPTNTIALQLIICCACDVTSLPLSLSPLAAQWYNVQR